MTHIIKSKQTIEGLDDQGLVIYFGHMKFMF